MGDTKPSSTSSYIPTYEDILGRSPTPFTPTHDAELAGTAPKPDPKDFGDWLNPFSENNPLFGPGGFFSQLDRNLNPFSANFVGKDQVASDDLMKFDRSLRDSLGYGELTPEQAVAHSQGRITLEEANNLYNSYPNSKKEAQDLFAQKRQAQLDSLSSLDDVMTQANGDIQKFLDKWDASIADFKNLSAQESVDGAKAIDAQYDTTAKELQARAANGIPQDQIDAQMDRLKYRRSEAKSKVVRDHEIAFNNARKEINIANNTTYGTMLTALGTLRLNTETARDKLRSDIEGSYYDSMYLDQQWRTAIAMRLGTGVSS